MSIAAIVYLLIGGIITFCWAYEPINEYLEEALVKDDIAPLSSMEFRIFVYSLVVVSPSLMIYYILKHTFIDHQ